MNMDKSISIKCGGEIYCDYKDLHHFQGDLKAITEEKFKELKQSLIDNGLPLALHIWIDDKKKKWTLDGHHRVMAFKALEGDGYFIPPIPCNVVQAKTRKEAAKIVLIANSRHARMSEESLNDYMINMDLTLPDLKDLDLIDLDMSQFQLEDPNEQNQGNGDEDAVPENVPVKAKLGELYLLGDHRLLCGDSTDKETVERLMNGEKADMVFTDPPYGAGFKIENDKPHEFKEVFDKAIYNATLFCDSTYIIACYYSCISEFVQQMRNLGFTFNEKIVWVKNLFGQGKVFHRKHEDFLFFSKGNHLKNFRNQFDDVIIADSVRNFMGSKNSHEAVGHPTQKPTEVLIKILEPLSLSGHIVLDIFGGSGSTLIACEKTNRKCFMMELDPHYIDVIIQRWQEFSGKLAYRLNDDGTKTLYNDIESE